MTRYGRNLIVIFALAAVEGVISWIIGLFSPLEDFLDGAVVEIEEDDLKDYMDNSEYDWGHNVKGYRFEE